jgi:hypothetical protein
MPYMRHPLISNYCHAEVIVYGCAVAHGEIVSSDVNASFLGCDIM